ncbi:uncharacterized protein LOC108212208 isoform X2 [Daucus carota subsp. sativus]|uniref:uncharacterized protein LOC108212208 isoform X2 n=1 Tax=Daucus carota subsp. sativus TaxID=79200 RepID=UPI003083928A
MADSEERPIPFRAACETRPSSYKDGATSKNGRPKLTITEDVLERRRLSKRRQNARWAIQQGATPNGVLDVSSREMQPPGHSSSQLNAADGGEASNAGSGKTFTMQPLPLKAFEDILRLMHKNDQNQAYQLFVSFFEIYGGKLFDLFNDRN